MVQPGDVAALFFAGHGVEIQNTNYILTSDIPEVNDGAFDPRSGAGLEQHKNTDNPVVLERFIKQYGETIFGPPAQAR